MILNKNQILTAFILAVLIPCFLLFMFGTAKAEINIVEPANDNSIIASDFDATVFINDTSIAQAQIRIAGYQWVTLEQATTNIWSYSFHIDGISNGDHVISAKYRKNGDVNWIYVSSTTAFTVQKPLPQLGQIDFIVKDKNGYVLPDVVVNPNGNTSNSNGIVHIGDQPLNTAINFTFSKSGYITNSLIVTFQNNTLIQTNIQLVKVGSYKKTMEVTGFDDAIIQNSLYYIKVKDADSEEPIDGAMIMIRQGERVVNIPGNTTNGGWRTISFDTIGRFQLMVTKKGYTDWEQEMTVFAPKYTPTPIPTATPTPTPSPVPTPILKPCADFGIEVTDDACRTLLRHQEEKEKEIIANNNANTTYIQPQQPIKDSGIGWGWFVPIVAICGFVYYKAKIEKKSSQPKEPEIKDPNEPSTLDFFVPESKELKTISCPLNCGWSADLPKDTSDEMIKAIQEAHKKEAGHSQ